MSAYDGIIGPNLRIANGLSRDMAYQYVDRIKPAWALVQNDPECAAGLASRGMNVVYRQSGDDAQDNPFQNDPATFVDKRIHYVFEPYKSRIWIHGTNEIDPDRRVDQYNLFISKECHLRGYKACLFNHGTNKTEIQWALHYETLKECLPKGDMAGVHLYDDLVHTAGGYGFMRLKHELGGLWGFTEIAYIRSIFDADHGYRNWSGTPEVPFSTEKHKWLWTGFAVDGERERMPCMGFSLENWRATPDGNQNGFGMLDNEDLKQFIALLNQGNKWKAPVMTQPSVPKPTGPTVNANLTSMVSTHVNVRTQPALTGVDIGDLFIGYNVNYYPDQPVNGWVYVIYGKLEGWVSLQNGGVVFTPTASPAPSGMTYTLEQVQEMRSLLLRLNNVLSEGLPSSSGNDFP